MVHPSRSKRNSPAFYEVLSSSVFPDPIKNKVETLLKIVFWAMVYKIAEVLWSYNIKCCFTALRYIYIVLLKKENEMDSSDCF